MSLSRPHLHTSYQVPGHPRDPAYWLHIRIHISHWGMINSSRFKSLSSLSFCSWVCFGEFIMVYKQLADNKTLMWQQKVYYYVHHLYSIHTHTCICTHSSIVCIHVDVWLADHCLDPAWILVIDPDCIINQVNRSMDKPWPFPLSVTELENDCD